MSPLPVHRYAAAALDTPLSWPRLCDGMPTVLVLEYAASASRSVARSAIRRLLERFLAEQHRASYVSDPCLGVGTDLEGLWIKHRIGVSISHIPGCSALAIMSESRVGIDLCVPEPLADVSTIAADYLGPAVAAELRHVDEPLRSVCFARAWAHREAQLKYFGEGIGEWDAGRERSRPPCNVAALADTGTWVGSTVWARNA